MPRVFYIFFHITCILCILKFPTNAHENPRRSNHVVIKLDLQSRTEDLGVAIQGLGIEDFRKSRALNSRWARCVSRGGPELCENGQLDGGVEYSVEVCNIELPPSHVAVSVPAPKNRPDDDIPLFKNTSIKFVSRLFAGPPL